VFDPRRLKVLKGDELPHNGSIQCLCEIFFFFHRMPGAGIFKCLEGVIWNSLMAWPDWPWPAVFTTLSIDSYCAALCAQEMTIFICWRPTVVSDCVLTWRTLKENPVMPNMTILEWTQRKRNTNSFLLEHIMELQVSEIWEREQNNIVQQNER